MKRSKHSLSHTKLFSCDMGELVPCGLFEVLPGDSIQMATSMLVRAAPLLSPIYHPVEIRLHHWFVPYRLIWDDFEDFITGGPNGTSTPVYPTRSSSGPAVGALTDYLGIPSGSYSPNLEYSVLPFRAYAMIYNENYRDPDLNAAVALQTTSGPDAVTNSTLQVCAWEKDYFTSSRPWEQKGPAITIPLGTSAPVVSTGASPVFTRTSDNSEPLNIQANAGDNKLLWNATAANAGARRFGATTGLQADLSSASAITINTLREALSLQRFQEARARFGSRYVEYLRYLGVQSSDARLQRPEYLGGGKQTIQFSEVLQTAEGTNAVGTLRGHGIGGMRSNRFRRYIEEHGIVMSLFSVRPKTIYMQGLPRLYNRRTKEDFWQREFEHIGQQEVLNKEIYALHSSRDGVFGYQDRYDEYRRQESSVAGEFKTTLNFWHMARDFSSDPALNATFTNCVPTERTFAVPSQDVIYCYARHSIQARRLVSKRGNSFIY